MKILNKVTLASLKKNKVRTIVTIIGILLSTAMFTAVTTSISSLRNYMLRVTIAEEGEWEGSLYGIEEEAYNELLNTEEIDRAVGIYEIGYMSIADSLKNGSESFDWADTSHPNLQFCNLSGDLEAAKSLGKFNLIEGRMPENENEILLSKEFVNYGKQKVKIGDTITGSIGYREFEDQILTGHDWLIYKNEKDASELAYSENLITNGQKKTYTSVGICDCVFGHYATPGFAVFCGGEFSTLKSLSQNKGIQGVYFTVKDQKELFDFLNRYQSLALTYDYHSHLLYTNGISRVDSFSNVYLGLGVILCIIIIFGSVALIYNAFSISINERIKQFGLLSSIGATKRQLKHSVLFEACAVSLFGIPLGIGAGILGMSITFYALRYRFVGLVGSANIPFSMHIEIWALLVAAVLAFCTVLISALLPARKAMKISAIEAIRQNSEIRISRKAVRTRGFFHKFFGMEGTLADKNFKRNRKKYRATVISLFVSILLFVSASSFVDYLKGSVTSVTTADNYDFRYYIYPDRGYTADEVRDVIASVEGVERAFAIKNLYGTMLVENNFLTDEYIHWMKESERYSYERELAEKITGRERMISIIYFYFMEDKEYIDYTEQNHLTDLGWFSEKKSALAFDSVRYELSGNRYTIIDMLKEKNGKLTGNFFDIPYDKGGEAGFSEDKLEEAETSHLTYTVVDAEFPIGLNRMYLSFVYPLSALSEFPEIVAQEQSMSEAVYVVGEGSLTETYNRICDALNAQGIPDSSFYNIAERDSFQRNMIVIINVFSYGFIVLISLIAAANVFNTVSTNISLRRREFAMLESIGMTKKGLYRMLNYECLLYGIKSLCYGLPAAVFVTFLIYRVVNEGFVQDFYIPVQSILIAVLSVFAVVFATMFYSVVKLEKNSLVDTLKNENV